jgi:hypothetical protein
VLGKPVNFGFSPYLAYKMIVTIAAKIVTPASLFPPLSKY